MTKTQELESGLKDDLYPRALRLSLNKKQTQKTLQRNLKIGIAKETKEVLYTALL